MTKVLRTLGFMAGLLLLARCTALIIAPTEADAIRAQEHWPDATVTSLQEGHQLYKQKCSSCHYLYPPEKFSAEKWSKEVDHMKERANLTTAETESILRYLLTMCEESATASTNALRLAPN